MRDNENAEKTWYLFTELESALGQLDDRESFERAQRILVAITATAGDVTRGSRRSVAQKGALHAKRLLDDVRAGGRGGEPASLIAGRLAALTDLLGLVATRRAPDHAEAEARRLLPTLRALRDGPISNKDVAARLSVEEETAWRYLRDARAAHLVEVERHGRQAMNRLSDLSYALDEAGVIALDEGGWAMQPYLAATTPDKSPPKAGRSLPLLKVAGE